MPATVSGAAASFPGAPAAAARGPLIFDDTLSPLPGTGSGAGSGRDTPLGVTQTDAGAETEAGGSSSSCSEYSNGIKRPRRAAAAGAAAAAASAAVGIRATASSKARERELQLQLHQMQQSQPVQHHSGMFHHLAHESIGVAASSRPRGRAAKAAQQAAAAQANAASRRAAAQATATAAQAAAAARAVAVVETTGAGAPLTPPMQMPTPATEARGSGALPMDPTGGLGYGLYGAGPALARGPTGPVRAPAGAGAIGTFGVAPPGTGAEPLVMLPPLGPAPAGVPVAGAAPPATLGSFGGFGGFAPDARFTASGSGSTADAHGHTHGHAHGHGFDQHFGAGGDFSGFAGSIVGPPRPPAYASSGTLTASSASATAGAVTAAAAVASSASSGATGGVSSSGRCPRLSALVAQSAAVRAAVARATELTPIPGVSGDGMGDDDDALDTTVRRERNKFSAAQYRKRRKVFVELLEVKVAELEAKAAEQEVALRELRGELTSAQWCASTIRAAALAAGLDINTVLIHAQAQAQAHAHAHAQAQGHAFGRAPGQRDFGGAPTGGNGGWSFAQQSLQQMQPPLQLAAPVQEPMGRPQASHVSSAGSWGSRIGVLFALFACLLVVGLPMPADPFSGLGVPLTWHTDTVSTGAPSASAAGALAVGGRKLLSAEQETGATDAPFFSQFVADLTEASHEASAAHKSSSGAALLSQLLARRWSRWSLLRAHWFAAMNGAGSSSVTFLEAMWTAALGAGIADWTWWQNACGAGALPLLVFTIATCLYIIYLVACFLWNTATASAPQTPATTDVKTTSVTTTTHHPFATLIEDEDEDEDEDDPEESESSDGTLGQ
jgi:hypothetical protein